MDKVWIIHHTGLNLQHWTKALGPSATSAPGRAPRRWDPAAPPAARGRRRRLGAPRLRPKRRRWRRASLGHLAPKPTWVVVVGGDTWEKYPLRLLRNDN